MIVAWIPVNVVHRNAVFDTVWVKRLHHDLVQFKTMPVHTIGRISQGIRFGCANVAISHKSTVVRYIVLATVKIVQFVSP